MNACGLAGVVAVIYFVCLLFACTKLEPHSISTRFEATLPHFSTNGTARPPCIWTHTTHNLSDEGLTLVGNISFAISSRWKFDSDINLCDTKFSCFTSPTTRCHCFFRNKLFSLFLKKKKTPVKSLMWTRKTTTDFPVFWVRNVSFFVKLLITPKHAGAVTRLTQRMQYYNSFPCTVSSFIAVLE